MEECTPGIESSPSRPLPLPVNLTNPSPLRGFSQANITPDATAERCSYNELHSAPAGRPTNPLPVISRVGKEGARGHDLNRRGSGFDQVETQKLMDLLDRLLPICKEEWAAVFKGHEQQFPHFGRQLESIWRKFATLHRKKNANWRSPYAARSS